MSQTNLLSATITDADKEAILQELAQVKQQLKHVLSFSLTPDERQGMTKMGDKSLAFVTKALWYAQQNPGLVPPYISVEEGLKDLNLTRQLSEIARQLDILSTALNDTIMIAGAEAYDAALQFHASVKLASRTNTAGSQAIYEDLAERFPGRSHKKAAAITAS